MCQQHLCSTHIVLPETGFVDLCQAHLADSCTGLQLMYARRTLVETEPLHSFGDRTRTDEHDFLAEGTQLDDLLCPLADGDRIQPLAVVGDERRADLDDDAF